MAKYKCPTLGDCDKANAGEVFERSPGEDLKCTGCGTQLEPQASTTSRDGSSKKVMPMVIGAVAIALLAGGGFYYSQREPAVTASVAESPVAESPVVPPAVESSTSGIAPSDAQTKELRQQGEMQLAKGNAEGAAESSSRAAVNELLKLAIAKMGQGKLDEADKDLAQARERGPQEPLVYYNTAVLRLKQGRTDDALKEFEASFMAGFSHFDKLEQDHDLDELRKMPRFVALVKQYDTSAH